LGKGVFTVLDFQKFGSTALQLYFFPFLRHFLNLHSTNVWHLGKGAILHSDQGSQYACAKFRKHLANQGYQQSMSRKGDCYDNAFAESFFSRLKGELLQDGIFDTFQDAFTEIFKYIECYYNSKRRRSALGYLCPEKFEEIFFSNLTLCT
jgi:transposase InsO family protein